MEKKSRMIDEYMETICTERKKNHIARRASRAYPTLSCEENREKSMSVDHGEQLLAAASKHMASFHPGTSAIIGFRVCTGCWDRRNHPGRIVSFVVVPC